MVTFRRLGSKRSASRNGFESLLKLQALLVAQVAPGRRSSAIQLESPPGMSPDSRCILFQEKHFGKLTVKLGRSRVSLYGLPQCLGGLSVVLFRLDFRV